jgi:pyruvate formate lyase activating enzyme
LKDRGNIFDIQRFSLHDGPGIRTLVFLKGCNLCCTWCANPESQRFVPDLFFDPTRCIGCLNCLKICKNNAVSIENGRITYSRHRCVDCGKCAVECYAEARIVKGRTVEIDEVLEEILKDEPFYAESGGGVTLGGGEPLDQPVFAAGLLRACKEKDLHTAMETAGSIPWKNLSMTIPHTDLFLFDIKHTNPEKLASYARADSDLIGSNLKALSGCGKKIVVRTPVVPGFNDTIGEIDDIARFAKNLNLEEIHLLPYHRYGQGKYGLMGRTYPFDGPESVSDERMEILKQTALKNGLRVQIGG